MTIDRQASLISASSGTSKFSATTASAVTSSATLMAPGGVAVSGGSPLGSQMASGSPRVNMNMAQSLGSIYPKKIRIFLCTNTMRIGFLKNTHSYYSMFDFFKNYIISAHFYLTEKYQL